MTKRDWLRNLIILFVLAVVSQMICGSIVVVPTIVCILIWGLYFVLRVCSGILFFKQYKFLKESFNYLKSIHKKRYKAYISNEKEKIDCYSAEIEGWSQTILRLGNFWLVRRLTQKQRKNIEEIVAKTEEMKAKDFVTF